ncbi:MAG: outer membrane lipoprotein chaperone LolA [Xanthomonadales bacterium]|nr:outer membrane lipoprotein chaperone LolA [Xanthomonadales bacterium]
MNRSSLSLFALSLLASAAPTAWAGDARSALARASADLVSVRAGFEQRVYNGDGSLRETATGSLALKAPRQFHWHYVTPYEQLVVADGTHVWLHDVDLEQVSVRRQADAEAQSPLVVLTDPASLEARYRVSEAGRRDGLDWLRLEPLEEDGAFSRAELGLDGTGVARMELVDSLGGRTTIAFSDWRRNVELEATLFRFQPPAGVDLVGDVDSLGEVRPLGD